MSLATQLYGMEAALFLAADDPGRFEIALDYATACAIRYGQAQITAGAHLPVVFDPAASPAVVPPAFFRELLLPRLQRLFAALRQAGAVANWLNIAGPTAPILPWYPAAGADIATFDYYVSPEQAAGLLPQTCLLGNLKSLDFLDAHPQRIAAAAHLALAAFRERGGSSFLPAANPARIGTGQYRRPDRRTRWGMRQCPSSPFSSMVNGMD